MATAAEPIVVEFTDEAHEDTCEFADHACSRVAVWVGTVIDMECEHNSHLYCEPHRAELSAYTGQFECRYCQAPGYELRWRRP